MTQGGYQVIIILPIKSKMAAARKRCFVSLRFLYFTESSPPSFKVRGLQMTVNFSLGTIPSPEWKPNRLTVCSNGMVFRSSNEIKPYGL